MTQMFIMACIGLCPSYLIEQRDKLALVTITSTVDESFINPHTRCIVQIRDCFVLSITPSYIVEYKATNKCKGNLQ